MEEPKSLVTLSSLDRFLIGGLVSALSGILWWVFLDVRNDVRELSNTAFVNANRITIVESRLSSIEIAYAELKADLKEHRKTTEIRR